MTIIFPLPSSSTCLFDDADDILGSGRQGLLCRGNGLLVGANARAFVRSCCCYCCRCCRCFCCFCCRDLFSCFILSFFEDEALDKIMSIISTLCCINSLRSSAILVAMLLDGQHGGKRRNLVTVNIEGGIILGYICMHVDLYVCHSFLLGMKYYEQEEKKRLASLVASLCVTMAIIRGALSWL